MRVVCLFCLFYSSFIAHYFNNLSGIYSTEIDEASSALDAPTEHDFLQRLRLLLESKENNLSAVLFITHKRSVLQACDRVAVLSHGRIAEKGLYDVLDKTKGDQLRKLMMGESSKLE